MPLINSQGAVTALSPPDALDPTQSDMTSVGDVLMVAFAFDSPVDGKAFSAAALLRAEGYGGTLIGVGPVGLDRLAYGFRAGFDVLELTDDEWQQLQPHHLSPFPHHYQPETRPSQPLKKSA